MPPSQKMRPAPSVSKWNMCIDDSLDGHDWLVEGETEIWAGKLIPLKGVDAPASTWSPGSFVAPTNLSSALIEPEHIGIIEQNASEEGHARFCWAYTTQNAYTKQPRLRKNDILQLTYAGDPNLCSLT